ncbi:hypothetical protein PVAND_007950 [Polypedilum vanderplanki]|uniref:Uncharacterized protein n=1 Tax=Polypedilum vanderplanki TaxID=319348 RepID=A0A9J6C891_POLVA|nr:hypothetical protein PVAND_007950 [Polypedilum vanderplanki]
MWLTKFLVLIIVWQATNVNALVEDVIDVLYLGREVIKTISSTWELADQVGVTNDIDLPFMKRKEKKILSRMAELSQEFKNAEMTIEEASHVTMQGIENYIQRNTKLQLVVHEMIDLVNRVENIHDQYEQYVANYDKLERSTLENFATRVIDDSSLSIKGMLPRIQRLVAGPAGSEFRVLGNRGLLELIALDMEVS